MRSPQSLLMLLLACLCLCVTPSSAAEGKVQVAITVDDLPAAGVQGDKSRKDVAAQFLSALKKHRLSGVYGFVNGSLARDMAERLEILKSWKEAGHLVGNHTFSHQGLSGVKAGDFISDLEKNESVLVDFAGSIEEFKVLRYPFLEEGETQEKRYEVRSYLARRNYRIAQVSMDFKDWDWNEPFTRCERARRPADLAVLRKGYLAHAVNSLMFFDQLARELYGRSVKQVLLVHFSPATSEWLDDLLTELERAGVEFIPLREALQDPIYSQDTTFIGAQGKPLLVQQAEVIKYKPKVAVPVRPGGDLEKTCR